MKSLTNITTIASIFQRFTIFAEHNNSLSLSLSLSSSTHFLSCKNAIIYWWIGFRAMRYDNTIRPIAFLCMSRNNWNHSDVIDTVPMQRTACDARETNAINCTLVQQCTKPDYKYFLLRWLKNPVATCLFAYLEFLHDLLQDIPFPKFVLHYPPATHTSDYRTYLSNYMKRRTEHKVILVFN
jgi:hypothetical protein